VLSDISSQRGGRVLGIKNTRAKFAEEGALEVDEKKRCVCALIPLSEMVGYSTYLRSKSKGEGAFVMNFSHYEKVGGQKQAEIMNNKFFY